MAPRSMRFGVRSRKLSNVEQVLDGRSNFIFCFGKHVMPLVPDAFAVVSTHLRTGTVKAYSPYVHKEDLCPSNRDICLNYR
jgi:hypothetical protein